MESVGGKEKSVRAKPRINKSAVDSSGGLCLDCLEDSDRSVLC